MKKEKLEVVLGSGNVFRDLDLPHAELLQLKAELATEIIRALNEAGITVREAERQTRIAAADFSRIRSANLARFTVDRLMKILERLGREVRVQVTVTENVGRATGAGRKRAVATTQKRRARQGDRNGLRPAP